MIKQAAIKLAELAHNETSRSEKLDESCFEENYHYKVCYRFLANMATMWEELGLDNYPTEEEAIEIAKEASPYFVWLLEDEVWMDEFRHSYKFMEDVWKDF